MHPIARIALGHLLVFACCACRNHGSLELGGSSSSVLGGDVYSYGATIDGNMTTWEVSFKDVQRTPDWLPGAAPPLTVMEAMRLASLEVPKYTSQPDAFQLEKVEYLHLGNHMSQSHKWIYLVTYERQYSYRERTFQGRGTITIPVLFDGTAVQGKKEK